MPIRIPIIGQSVSTPFVPQQSRQAIQVDDPRGKALQGLSQGLSNFADGYGKYLKRQPTDTVADREDADLGRAMRNADTGSPTRTLADSGQSAGLVTDAAATSRSAAAGDDDWRAQVLETQRQQNVNSWIMRAYADNAEYGDALANHLDPGASQAATPPGGTDSSAAPGNSGAPTSPTSATAPNPANLLQTLLRGSSLGGLIGGAAGSAGAAAPGAPADPTNSTSPTDPGIHGHTGAWLNGYDASARATIAAAPDKAAAQTLVQQLGANRAQGAQAIMLREAQANVAARQNGYLADIQRIAATQLSANPESLPRILDLVDRHPIQADGDQAAFNAQVRQTLVDAAMQSLIARDPQGAVMTLEDRTQAPASTDQFTDDEVARDGATNAAANDGLTDPAVDHPVISLLTPDERSHYLQQAQGALYTAQSQAQADVLQRADAAIRGAQSGNPSGNPSSTPPGTSPGTPATPPPSREEFIRALGDAQGAQRFDAMQQALTARQWRNALLPLPGARLSEAALANTSPPFRDVIRQIQEERRQSPIDAAFEAGSYGLQPMPFTSQGADSAALADAIAGRAAVAGAIARAYDTMPALFSREEVGQLAAMLQGQKPDQQQTLLRQLQQSTADPGLHQTTLRALSAHEPVIALAGLHMAAEEDAQLGQAMGDAGDTAPGAPSAPGVPGAQPAAQVPAVEGEGADDTGPLVSGSPAASPWGGSGKVDAADVLLRGNALLQPPAQDTDKAAQPFPMPSAQEMWHSFSEFTGDSQTGRPGAEAMEFQGAKAALAVMRWQEGDRSTTLDPGMMRAAIYVSRFGSVPLRELAFIRSDNGFQPADGQFGGNSASGDSPLMNVGYIFPDNSAKMASAVFPNLFPHDSGDSSASAAPAQPGAPPIAPIDRSAAAAKQQSFVTGLQNLLTTRQVGVPASYPQDEVDTQHQMSLGARQQLRDIGQWASQDPTRGNAILQGALHALLTPDGNPDQPQQPLVGDDLKAALKSKGKRTNDAFYTVAGLVELLQHGDPTNPDVARQIGAGLAFVTAPENARFAPGLLLGLLSANGSPSPAIEKILKASEQIAPEDRSAYNWQALTKDQLIAPITTLVEAGARAAMGSGPVGRVFGSLQNSLAEMGQRAVSSANKAGQQVKGSISEMGQQAGDAIRGGMGPQLAGAGAGADGAPANTQAGPKQGPMMASGSGASSEKVRGDQIANSGQTGNRGTALKDESTSSEAKAGGQSNENANLADLPIHVDKGRFYVRADELLAEQNIRPKHPTNELQREGSSSVGHGGVQNLNNEDLLKFGGPQGNDPISGYRAYGKNDDLHHPGSRFHIETGHHRLEEIAKRVREGKIPANQLIEVQARQPN